ncbi:glutathione ABC transporter substrate-binding protein [Virgibacillus pantothenticus]|uniref:glutathione ABC transporter substrate-binding protein n=1 Tax=Virgibacillus TaxID=84406 RepID=UPI00090A6FA8|nr:MULTISPECIES: glutathione ABC transporter substrate-binding protein [Virgibacillus]API91604.1 glutathione ABC transporter substrate-binding protein [Virgibacillus sp. 6R]MBS7426874.1 glutathione ABC transporter substrate-binding protein [Virgibacillus sp. 19R1-5]MBU8568321.1 glutathione ABC transporter substrate-binding protein [Virgibacillus pantothenticus]MBU8602226.1 glutathione ABC transporter substrate-binding protein [Virgibacillus pantothenticus]MBU8636458.1 glutathione ABC transport
MKNKKLLWLVSLLAMLTFVLAACAGDGEPESKSEGEGSEKEGSGSGGDLVIALPSDVVSLSPHGTNDIPSGQVADNIYETLTVLDENQEPQPGLAKEWKEVDETTWEFQLQEGVKFHDGEELTAEVVKKNFDRLVDEKIASPRAFLFEAVESVEAKDDLTLVIKLEYPYAPLLANLAHSGTAIMSPKIIEEDYAQMEDGGDVDAYINKNPIGTGPFKLDEWKAGEEVVISRNDDYWGEKAKLDTATFKVVSEQSSRVAELETGVAHVADQIGPNNISRVDKAEGMSALQEPSTSLSYVGFNMKKEPFDDKKVRQAISMAIDKEEIVSGVYNNVGIPAKGPLAPPVFGYDESVGGLEYDVKKAKELLAEAGYEDGFKTTIWTNDNEQRVDTAVTIQNQLKEIGVDVKIEELEWGAFLDRTSNGEHDMFVLGWVTSTGDADYGMYPLFHSSAVGEPGNRSFLENEELDKILDDARHETDPEVRKELYSKAQEMLVDLAPMIYTHHQEYLLGVSDSVKDFSVNAQGIYQIKQAYIEE